MRYRQSRLVTPVLAMKEDTGVPLRLPTIQYGVIQGGVDTIDSCDFEVGCSYPPEPPGHSTPR